MVEKIIKILIVEDHKLIRVGIKSVFDEAEGYDVIAEAETAKEAINKANKYDEKTTPMKPIRKRIYYNCRNGECDKSFIYYCPVCNFNSVEKDYANFCPNCGQKLSWDDEDE